MNTAPLDLIATLSHTLKAESVRLGGMAEVRISTFNDHDPVAYKLKGKKHGSISGKLNIL